MSSSEENPGSQSDPSEQQQRSYTCFCGKVFTTYPGIYLHLKSKHNTLFLNYNTYESEMLDAYARRLTARKKARGRAAGGGR